MVDLNQLLPPLGPPFTVEQLRMLFNQQLEHYIQETEVFKAENQLLKDQLVLERSARIQAQVRSFLYEFEMLKLITFSTIFI